MKNLTKVQLQTKEGYVGAYCPECEAWNSTEKGKTECRYCGEYFFTRW